VAAFVAAPTHAVLVLSTALAAAINGASVDGPTMDALRTPLGGAATVTVSSANAFAQPAPTLATTDLRRFTFGNRLFNTRWVAAPASVDGFDGLGPVFNRVSCSSCHTRDGRGQPPAGPGAPFESMLVRLSQPGVGAHGGVRPVPGYGDQLNEKAVAGVPAEGRTVVEYAERAGRYADGTPYSLAAPTYRFTDLAFGPLPVDVLVSPRVAPPVFGLGLLEAVPEASIVARADPDDADADGISGRPNRVWDEAAQAVALGRFGWKANQPSVRQQNAGAALGDLGLTTRLFPRENVAEGQDAAAHAPSGGRDGGPELADDLLDRLTFYVQALAVPAARNVEDPAVRGGARLFAALHCAACHTPTLVTADQPDVPSLSWQVIHPFTDLLLHDMGPELADGRPDFEATGSEWRTPPLWGVGLTAAVNRHTRFLHDGRARSLEEAVLWHGGEGAAAREGFTRLEAGERRALIAFLESL
jgi:CxxC motif-containing protein (DUF1111 family)